MKTTIDLPDSLFSEIELRAAHEGREVKDVVVELLSASMSPTLKPQADDSRPVAKTLPLIKVRPAQPADSRKLTTQEWCDWIKDADLHHYVPAMP
jgi:hypothetical protein